MDLLHVCHVGLIGFVLLAWCSYTCSGYRIVEISFGSGDDTTDYEQVYTEGGDDNDAINNDSEFGDAEDQADATSILMKLNPGVKIIDNLEDAIAVFKGSPNWKKEKLKHATCKSNEDCSGDKACDIYTRLCERCRFLNELCRRDENCCNGGTCIWGRCRNVKYDGTEMSLCRHDNDCLKGHCCAREHGQSVCKKYLQLGEDCERSLGGLIFSIHHSCPCMGGLHCARKSSKTWKPTCVK